MTRSVLRPALLGLAVLIGACHRGATPLDLSPIALDPIHSSAEAIARAKADSSQSPYTTADVAFMTGMIGHHSQAITMSRLAPGNGASSSVRTLAARIINAQTDEIQLMRQWLSDRRLPVPEADPRGMKHVMNGQEHVMAMPGMLTESQMQELAGARGRTFDRLFLTYMIQHHAGATTMVRDLLATDGAAQNERVFKFASDVNVDQTTEIARMRQMLEALSR